MSIKFINITKPTRAAIRFKRPLGIRESVIREKWTAYVLDYSNPDDNYGVVGRCPYSPLEEACRVAWRRQSCLEIDRNAYLLYHLVGRYEGKRGE